MSNLQNTQTFTELEKRKVLAILGSSRELIGMSTAKLYTSCRNSNTWLFSDLEGFLCFILDYHLKTRLFVLFDPDSYERLFQFELYNDFNSSYQALSDDFFCFEFGSGFIGFKFYDVTEANNLSLCVKKFNEDLISILFEGNKKSKKYYYNKSVIKTYCEMLQEKFTAGRNNFDENYIEDGLEICKPRYFELMNSIVYDRDKQEFIIDKVPPQFKQMFRNLGLKKSDFKNTQLALNIFKHFIESIDILDNEKRERCDKTVFTKGMKSNIMKIISDNTENSVMEESKLNICDESMISSCSQIQKSENNKPRESRATVMSNASSDSNGSNNVEDVKAKKNNISNNNTNTNIPKVPSTIPNLPTTVPKVPSTIPNVPKVPNIPSTIPNVPKVPNIPSNIPNVPSTIPNVPKVPNIPNVPKVPNVPSVPNIPNVPKVPTIPNVPKTPVSSTPQKTDTPSENNSPNVKPFPTNTPKTTPQEKSNPSPTKNIVSMFDEMKSITLKKVDHSVANTVKDNRPAKISKNETSILQQTLSEAIKQRRMELTKHDKSDSGSENSDWSD